MTGEGVHGIVEVVLIEIFVGWEAAGGSEKRALRRVMESEFGAGEEDAGEDHGFEESALAGCADICEEDVEVQGLPGIDEDGEATEIQGGVEFDGIGLEGGFAGEVGGDELTELGRKLGDVADGAGARAVGSAEGFADEMGGVNFPVFARFGGLNKNVLQKYQAKT
ncbi:MAG: hypothetical protein ACKOHM_02935 [Spartobacteria bacterium]